MPSVEAGHDPATAGAGDSPGRAGPILALWIVLAIALRASLWVTGFEPKALADAVDRGAARAEASRIGEVGDDVIRKAIQLQRDTLPFWTTLARLGDFAVEPAALVIRALAVATLFAAAAALTGRPVNFSNGLTESAKIQGFWVFGLAVRVALAIALRREDVETSLAVLLPPGTHPAATVLLARQADPFALIGWAALAWRGWRRGQVNLATAIVLCGMLAMSEAIVRVSCGLIVGAGMRLSILPD
jgi:hypothetical protein